MLVHIKLDFMRWEHSGGCCLDRKFVTGGESRWNSCYDQTQVWMKRSFNHLSVSVRMRKVSVDGGRLLYLSLWRHLLLGGGKLLLQPGGRKWHHRLQLLGVGFWRDVLLLVGVLQAIFGEVGHLREEEESVTPEMCDAAMASRFSQTGFGRWNMWLSTLSAWFVPLLKLKHFQGKSKLSRLFKPSSSHHKLLI